MSLLSTFSVSERGGEAMLNEPLAFDERRLRLIRLPLTWLDNTEVAFLWKQTNAPELPVTAFSTRPQKPSGDCFTESPSLMLDGMAFRPEPLIFDHSAVYRTQNGEKTRKFDIVWPGRAGGFSVINQAGVLLSIEASLFIPISMQAQALAAAQQVQAA